MYSKTKAASKTSRNSVMGRARFGSGILQHDLHHHVAGVPAAVHRLLDQLIKVLEHDEFLRVVGPMIKLLQEPEHHLVGLALGKLEALLRLADLLHVRPAAELLDHE